LGTIYDWVRISIPIGLLILGFIFIHSFTNKISQFFGGGISYQTITIKDTLEPSSPDTVVMWIEKWRDIKLPDIVTYPYVVYQSPLDWGINRIESNGKTIQFYTQRCGSLQGERHDKPWMAKYTAVVSKSGSVAFVGHRQFFDLHAYIGYIYPINKLELKSTLNIPFNLIMEGSVYFPIDWEAKIYWKIF